MFDMLSFQGDLSQVRLSSLFKIFKIIDSKGYSDFSLLSFLMESL